MSNYLVRKFADILTSKDILELFRKLEVSLGSVTKAAQQCDLERKTIYDWRKTGNLKLPTKKKVLGALLEVNTEGTLDYMTKRSKETVSELLNIYLTTLYEQALETEIDRNKFQDILKKFEETREDNAGLIIDTQETEISNMLNSLVERALELKTAYDPQPPDVIKLSRLAAVLPMIINEVHREIPLSDYFGLSHKLNLPIEFVSAISRSIEDLRHIYERPRPKIAATRLTQHTGGTIVPIEKQYMVSPPTSEPIKEKYEEGEFLQTVPIAAT